MPCVLIYTVIDSTVQELEKRNYYTAKKLTSNCAARFRSFRCVICCLLLLSFCASLIDFFIEFVCKNKEIQLVIFKLFICLIRIRGLDIVCSEERTRKKSFRLAYTFLARQRYIMQIIRRNRFQPSFVFTLSPPPPSHIPPRNCRF